MKLGVSSPPTNSGTQQLSRDLITGEQAAIPKEVEPIKDNRIEEHQPALANISAEMSNKDIILSVLNELPEQFSELKRFREDRDSLVGLLGTGVLHIDILLGTFSILS